MTVDNFQSLNIHKSEISHNPNHVPLSIILNNIRNFELLRNIPWIPSTINGAVSHNDREDAKKEWPWKQKGDWLGSKQKEERRDEISLEEIKMPGCRGNRLRVLIYSIIKA